jgi:aspartyl/asparaginyl-tRNA synthetase
LIDRILISKALSHVGEVIRICGFVQKVRDQKKMQFLIVQDHTGSIQIVHEKASNSELTALVPTLSPGTAVEVTGRVLKNEQVMLGSVELVLQSLATDSVAAPELPIVEDSGPETQANWRYLALRWPKNRLIFEVQTAIEIAMRQYWQEQQFIEIHSPKLMHSASESGAETFSMDYFDLGKAYLAQSPQFYKQMAIAAGFDRVFEIGPVFRAEPSFTARHATEFTSIDLEMSWITSHEDIMQFEERWLRHTLEYIEANLGARIQQIFGAEIRIPTLPFPRIAMSEAIELLGKLGHTIPATTKAGDLDPQGERILAAHFLQEQGHEFYFLTDYPVHLRPFYHMRSESDATITKSFDLMWKGVEITTGAQREHRYDVLHKQAEAAGLADSVEYYLDFFKYGCPPHGGFGTGLARIVMLLLNLPSIRDSTFLHRGPQRLKP